jgi:hypothetical protein
MGSIYCGIHYKNEKARKRRKNERTYRQQRGEKGNSKRTRRRQKELHLIAENLADKTIRRDFSIE